MGSVQSQNELCPACGKETLFRDFYYRSGEEYCCCIHCNYEYSFTFRRDQKEQIVQKNIPYELDGDLVIMTKTFKGAPIDPIPVTDTMTRDDVYNILNQDVPHGVNCLYHWENGKARQLLGRGDDFDFMKDKQSGKTRFILKEAIMDVRMRIPRPDGSVIFIQSFQDEDIEMADRAGQNGSMLSETSYLIRYESPSGKSSWTTIEKEKAHQMGEQTLIKSIIVNEDGSLVVNFPTE